MTDRHDLPQDPALSGLYRAGADAEPPSALDARILAAAHAAVRPPALSRPWWKRLALPVGVAASALLAVMLSLTVQRHTPETAAPADEAAVPQPAPAGTPADGVPAAPLPFAQPASPLPSASPPREEKKAKAPAPVPAPPAAAETAAPPTAKGEALADRAVEAGRVAPLRELRAAPAPATAPAGTAATPAVPMPADAWIGEIRELLRQGKTVAAARRLAEFRQAYPDYLLPDDLKSL